MLEARQLLTTTMYLDFGAGFGNDGLTMTVDKLKSAPVSGPNLTAYKDKLTVSGTDTVTFKSLSSVVNDLQTKRDTVLGLRILRDIGFPLKLTEAQRWLVDESPIDKDSFDFNGDGKEADNDLSFLQDSIVSIVNRSLEPFDIDVVVSDVSRVEDIQNLYAGNANATDGQFDAWVPIGGVSAGQKEWSVGESLGAYGLAARGDLDKGKNASDEAALVFADQLLSHSLFAGVFPADYGLANVAVHEAGHTFGLHHTSNKLDSDTTLLTRSDLMVEGGGKGEKLQAASFFSRFDLPKGDGNTVESVTLNAYDQLKNDPDIGLRKEAPAYVTGTGAHDRIRVTSNGGTTATVTVEAYRRPSFKDSELIDSTTYTIDTSHGILIETGHGDDSVSIDPAIKADAVIRGGLGNDKLYGGSGNDELMGEAGDDRLFGRAGSDRLQGNAGNDYLFGGTDGRRDTLIGGEGADTFYSPRVWRRQTFSIGLPYARTITLTTYSSEDFVKDGDRLEGDFVRTSLPTPTRIQAPIRLAVRPVYTMPTARPVYRPTVIHTAQPVTRTYRPQPIRTAPPVTRSYRPTPVDTARPVARPYRATPIYAAPVVTRIYRSARIRT